MPSLESEVDASLQEVEPRGGTIRLLLRHVIGLRMQLQGGHLLLQITITHSKRRLQIAKPAWCRLNSHLECAPDNRQKADLPSRPLLPESQAPPVTFYAPFLALCSLQSSFGMLDS